MNFVKRIPKLEQIAPVYAVVVVIIYTWSILHFFWRLPSWIYFSSVGEIAVIFAYTIFFNLLESIVIILVPILMSMALPQKWFYDRFVSMGTLLVLFGLGYFIYFNDHLNAVLPFPLQLVYWTPVIAVGLLGLVFLIDRIGILNKLLEEVANRFVIFLYISIPISLISLLTVLIRNIAGRFL